ncbi:hypothetical protein T11_11063 [Trichinella zimbabwensis]|uniref:Uncharacterized protein n=1 Tax=Trichinella zimbabwensis TaxID=268475 RepID=A0A0V1GX43_9BILA|nr:hypothetical protein T11_11063 [Trichinella zimbabwensis]
MTPPDWWRHCPTQDNPADLASRGCPLSKLAPGSLWNSGPRWLQLEESAWPKLKIGHGRTLETGVPRDAFVLREVVKIAGKAADWRFGSDHGTKHPPEPGTVWKDRGTVLFTRWYGPISQASNGLRPGNQVGAFAGVAGTRSGLMDFVHRGGDCWKRRYSNPSTCRSTGRQFRNGISPRVKTIRSYESYLAAFQLNQGVTTTKLLASDD